MGDGIGWWFMGVKTLKNKRIDDEGWKMVLELEDRPLPRSLGCKTDSASVYISPQCAKIGL